MPFLRFSPLALVAILCVWTSASPTQAAVPFEDGQRVLFLGDSITQDGRYVALAQAYLWAEYPDREIEVVNLGLSSETVSGLSEPVHNPPRPAVMNRVEHALRLADPDWVIVCYGMNDGIYHPAEPRIVDAYRAGLDRLLTAIHAAGAKTVLLTPPVFDAQSPSVQQAIAKADAETPYGYQKPYTGYDETLAALSRVALTFAKDSRVDRVIDLHTSMAEFLRASKTADPEFVYGDGVHPPLSGHAAMAAALLSGLGEPEASVHRVLARTTGLRPPAAGPEKLPSDAAAESIRTALFERNSQLSAAYRRTIPPRPGDAPRSEANERAAQQALAEARKLATEREHKLRAQIEAANEN